MTELKTRPNEENVEALLAAIPDEERRNDCIRLMDLMQRVTGAPPRRWGSTIIGFGTFQYKGKSGRKGEWFLCGLAARKKDLTIYVNAYLERYPQQLERLGRFKSGKSCLHIKRLSDIDELVLTDLLATSSADLKSGRAMGC